MLTARWSRKRVMSSMQLDERKNRILQAIIESYISTGEPVGSRTLSKLDDLQLSPATIRNEMSDLEEMGLLEQPHVSAGRIPSDKGYRYYVENIMPRPLAVRDEMQEMQDLKNLIAEKSEQVHGLIREIAELYTRLINYTVFALPPEFSDEIVLRGMTNFLNFPEYNNIAKARRILEFLDNSSNLVAALPESTEKMNIIIGKENLAEEIQDCSVITASYRTKDNRVGTIGIIGPTRMDYSKAVTTLDFLTQQLEDWEGT